MSKDTKYEFGLISKKEQMKILAARAVVYISTVGCLVALLFRDGVQSTSSFYLAGWVLSGIFVHVNLMNVKSELIEIFEYSFDHKGLEYVLAGGALTLYGFGKSLM